MKDETFVFISDVKEKKSVGRSARARRTHTGKGGRVKLPSDNLSKKELQSMNGECKSYRLNEPMAWKEFKAMPDDVKITYIKLLRQKFNCPDIKIGEMMGADKDQISRTFKKLGLSQGKTKKRINWDKEGFYAWANGVDKLPTPVPEEEPIQEPVITSEEPEAFVEDDLPFDFVPVEEPDPIYPKLPELHELHIALCAEIDELKKRVDGLLKVNEELHKVNEKTMLEKELLQKECDNLRVTVQICEEQLEVVQLIFWGNEDGQQNYVHPCHHPDGCGSPCTGLSDLELVRCEKEEP